MISQAFHREARSRISHRSGRAARGSERSERRAFDAGLDGAGGAPTRAATRRPLVAPPPRARPGRAPTVWAEVASCERGPRSGAFQPGVRGKAGLCGRVMRLHADLFDRVRARAHLGPCARPCLVAREDRGAGLLRGVTQVGCPPADERAARQRKAVGGRVGRAGHVGGACAVGDTHLELTDAVHETLRVHETLTMDKSRFATPFAQGNPDAVGLPPYNPNPNPNPNPNTVRKSPPRLGRGCPIVVLLTVTATVTVIGKSPPR